MSQFTLELIQAVNDWQRGGSPDQKRRRGKELKRVAAELPLEFRRVSLCCFRQLALDPNQIWELHENLRLAETVSAWTLDTEVAKTFKGGVPPSDLQGIILDVVPSPENVIVNLNQLYQNGTFLGTVAKYQSQIKGYASGIGRYQGSQHEVVLELGSVPVSGVYALGGFSSSRRELAAVFFGHNPSADELKQFDGLAAQIENKLGPNWITGEAKNRVLRNTLIKFGVLKERENRV